MVYCEKINFNAVFVYQMEKQYMIATPHTLQEICKHLKCCARGQDVK